ncbi:High mobility group protein B4 [Orchesella cincta]|uniref:High mobility group protein B4 n=1 Tax=Orchesella cincta TaxID=48709 RepID=A0A1D2NCT8_ORCCI|nr:High mobility group protein B4 [Orchesella cincta]
MANPSVNLMENITDRDVFNRLSEKEKWKQLRNIKKPKRPLNGYTRFVTDFMNRNKDKRGHKKMTDAAQAWKNLSDDQRNVWEESSIVAKATYSREVAVYNRARKATKKPPSAFALFVKNRWKAEKKKQYPDGKRPKFKVIHKQIVKDWKKLSEKERRTYFSTADRLLTLFKKERKAVINGEKDFNLFWGGDAMENYHEDEAGDMEE